MEINQKINEVALRYLEHRPRTEHEMKEKLLEKGFEEDAINEEILHLKERKFIDDIAYVEMYLRYALGKRKALYRIKYELSQKGVSQFDIEDGIYLFEDLGNGSIAQIEKENALYEAEKIIRNKEEIDQKTKDKIGRRLNTLGYSTSLIFDILNKYR